MRTARNYARNYGRISTVLAAMLLAPSVLLSGCSNSDSLTAEKLAAVDAAAVRAEKAADRAEKAAGKLDMHLPAAVGSAAPSAEEQDPGQAERDQQEAASTPTNRG